MGMDNLTHSLVGALIGQAGLKRRTGLAMPALVIGANIPDLDAACIVYGVESLAMRRGLTHGPIAWVLLPLLLAGLLFAFDRWQSRRGRRPANRLPVHFGWLYALSFIACLSHPAMDWLNVYGIRLLEPFSSQWFYGDTLFIIDVWLWLGMGAALWVSLRREKRRMNWRLPARAALLGALVYIGINFGISQAAKATARGQVVAGADVIANPPPLTFWRREVVYRGEAGQWMQSAYAPFSPAGPAVRLAPGQCANPPVLAQPDPARDAFLFWSRAPFAEKTADGSIRLRDARFYDPLARDRFAVTLPAQACAPFP